MRVITWVLVIALAVLFGYLLRDSQEANCPTEDSCTIDYYDGEWHIEQVTH